MKKLIVSSLVISILFLSGNMLAQGRKGADLIIQKRNGQQIRGELIAVKNNSLVLMERKSGADVTADVNEIRIIVVARKSKALIGVVSGVLIGGISGALIGSAVAEKKGTELFDISPMINTTLYSTLVGVIGAIIGGGIGGALGAGAGKPETIQLTGKLDSEIREILKILRKKARVHDTQ